MPKKQTVRDVEETLSYLLSVVSSARRDDRESLERGAYSYAREILVSAEQPIRKLGMYETTEHAVNESERLILAGKFDEADNLLLSTVREMMEKSGTNARLSKLYGTKPKDPK